MHIQIVNFQLSGIDDAQYRAGSEEDAAVFADVPGLLSKIWLADQSTNTYGGVYLWRDRDAMDSFVESDLFRGIRSDPHVASVTSRDFSVLAAPTSITGGLLAARA